MPRRPPPLLPLLAVLAAALLFAALLFAAPLRAQDRADASFMLVNRAASAVRELYVTPAGDANWGRNRLHGAAIPPGGSFALHRRPDGNCVLDLRVVFADGHNEERRGLNTCTLDALTVGGPEQAAAKAADDPSFRLINRGAVALRELYVAPAGGETSGGPGWGRNRLEPGGLPADAATVVRIGRSDQCIYDLRVVFADHKALEKRHADLCRITDLPVP